MLHPERPAMSVALNENRKRRETVSAAGPYLASPLAILAIAVIAVCLLLSLPVSVPIGPMYWDVYIYYDAANRIFSGQAPILDFFTPVGPLGYYLFAGWLAVFPNGQPALMAHWSLLAVTAPLMALVVWDVQRRSRIVALALLVPFLIFALLPFNTREFYPFPGSDAFGIYNRQVCQMLYVLVAAILFMQERRLLAVVITLAIMAMFFLKITGFVAGGIIAAYAFMAGRVPLRYAVASAVAFFAILGILEIATGIVSAYVRDILLLVEMNSGTLAPRFLQSASLNFGMLAPTGMLALLLIWSNRAKLIGRAKGAFARASLVEAAAFFDSKAFWLLVVLFAGILFETQNTGSQALIFLWPVVLAVILGIGGMISRPALMIAVAGLSAAISLPPAVAIAERAARAYVGGIKNTHLEASNLKTFGHVNMREEVADRVEHMLGFYPEHRALYDDMIAVGELPTPVLYSDFDFQIIYLSAVDRAIDSIHALEAARGVRFETIASLNFVNPFPWLMDRRAPRHIAIGADPFRAVPAPGSAEETAVAETDLVLYPTCPPTTANAALYKLYEPALAKHRRIRLDACYDAFVNPKFTGIE